METPASYFYNYVSRRFYSFGRKYSLSSAAMPGWVWLVMGLLYLLIVTIYWSPGEEAYNDRELLAFVIVVLAALMAFGCYVEHKYGILWQLANEFWRILLTQGGAK